MVAPLYFDLCNYKIANYLVHIIMFVQCSFNVFKFNIVNFINGDLEILLFD